MEPLSSYRPRVSRETRLLLTTGAAAIVVLWVLARVRFDDPAVIGNPVVPVLSQLTGGAHYNSLAAEFADAQARVLPSLVAVDLGTVPTSPKRLAGVRWRDGLALVVMPAAAAARRLDLTTVRAVDRATGLAVVRVPGQAPSSEPTQWVPPRVQQPRYLAATDVVEGGSAGAVTLRPVFVGSFVPTESGVWPGTLWAVPADSTLRAGSFVFATTGDFVGLVARENDRLAIVPGATVLAEADRLLRAMPGVAGTLRLEVQALSEPLASLTGASAGVVVVWVDAKGPAGGALDVGDVIEAMDGDDLRGRAEWDARISRLESGQTLTLRIRRRGQVQERAVKAAAEPTGADGALGLSLRRRAGTGAEVTSVERMSAAARAGLLAGDVITLFGDVHAPTPQQIGRAFAALREPGDQVMVAVTRDDAHWVTVLER